MQPRILVIEDDDSVRETVKIVLTMKGYSVYTSADGLDVFPLISMHKPDLVLTDIFLGDADGRLICKKIKNDPLTKHIPVIIMSGSSEKIYKTINSVGANDIVLKPFDENTLLNRVERQLSA